jgi:hypothetical protein
MDNKENKKQCCTCKSFKLVTEFYFNRTYNKYGYRCKECEINASKESQLKNKKKWFHEDGYMTEKDHFNAAIRQYAEVFNLPSLTRHIRK